MEKTFFKIVIPNYNNMAYIKECLDSILNQTFQDFKIVLVDDQSTDMSYEFAKMYERKYPDKMVVLRAETKRYAGGCRNIGIDYPLGCEYYYFLDSDDFLCNQKVLANLYSHVHDLPDLLLFSFYQLINGKAIHHNARSYVFNPNSNWLMSSAWNSSSSKIVRGPFIEYFLEGCMRAEDTFQWLRLLDKNPKVKQVYDEVFVYRRHCKSTTMSPIFKQHRSILIKALLELKTQMRNPHVIKSIENRIMSKREEKP